jgi:hypothetical protein
MSAVMDGTGIDLGRRAETLSVSEFCRLSNFFSSKHSESAEKHI